MTKPFRLAAGLCAALLSAGAMAQRPAVTAAMAPFVREQAPLVALTHVRVIDGTGAPAGEDQTILLRNDRIVQVGPARRIAVPPGAKLIDLSGRTVLPGLVQLHEHLWMGGGPRSVAVSYSRLLLAAGVTTIRTAGSFNPYADLQQRKRIEAGDDVGPWMDLSIYLDVLGAPRLFDAAATRRYLDFWLDSGFTSVKAYSVTNPVALKEAITIAHGRGLKITGHLCGVTYAAAAKMGIDNIEHGFAMAPDFLEGPPPPALSPAEQARDGECSRAALHAVDRIDPMGREAGALIATLVAHKVAVTSTLPALEDITVGIPEQPGIEMLASELQTFHRDYRAKLRADSPFVLPAGALAKSAAMERRFMQAGGLLVSGTDPAVPSAGVIAGYASARQLELMVDNGFTPLEAIRVSTLNGATYLRRDATIGSIAAGKQADLLVVRGNPLTRMRDVRNVEIVFKQGIGYDPEALRASVRGMVGIK